MWLKQGKPRRASSRNWSNEERRNNCKTQQNYHIENKLMGHSGMKPRARHLASAHMAGECQKPQRGDRTHKWAYDKKENRENKQKHNKKNQERRRRDVSSSTYKLTIGPSKQVHTCSWIHTYIYIYIYLITVTSCSHICSAQIGHRMASMPIGTACLSSTGKL